MFSNVYVIINMFSNVYVIINVIQIIFILFFSLYIRQNP
jgi:hypothetical protein